MAPEAVADAAVLALSIDPQEYKPWILERGRTRPVVMLHLRRFEPRSGLWTGWQISYPHLIAVEYTGDTMFSLDFGSRQFVVMGRGLGELVAHLQNGSVLTITEFSDRVWRTVPANSCITSIKCLGADGVP